MTTANATFAAPIAAFERFAPTIGRTMLGGLFLISAITKIQNFAGTQAYMESVGVPGVLLPGVIAMEILAPLALIIGWNARLAALALAGFSIGAAFLFHFDFADQIQSIMFLKNIAIAGGLLFVAATRR